MRVLAFFVLIAAASPLFAQEGEVPLPRPRPEAMAPAATQVPLPKPRPEAVGDKAAPTEEALAGGEAGLEPADGTGAPADPVEAVEQAPAAGPAEPPVPPRVYQTTCPAVIAGQVEATALSPIDDNMCRVQSPLAVTGVLANGRMVPFSGAATLDCGMAAALPAWVADVDGYLAAYADTRIESVIVGTSYMCRNVNGAATGNLSFHSFADALDVVGFTLADGRTVSVEAAWNGSGEQERRIVRFAHDAACTRFTTVLGPEANAQHHDHLHLDLGCHGSRCVARLCQ
jgi:hypothetical protein